MGLGGGGGGGPAGGEVFEVAAALGEGFVEEKPVVAVEDVEDDEDGGDVAEDFGRDALRPRRWARVEKESARWVAGFQARISPSRMAGLAMEEQACDEVGGKKRYVVAIAGVEGCAGVVDVELGADAVEFVLELGSAEGGKKKKIFFFFFFFFFFFYSGAKAPFFFGGFFRHD